jgi:ABC-2 type transport system ATP-binding protein
MLDDIERVADRVMIMVEGRIVVNTTVPDFLSRIVTWSCQCAEEIHGVSIPGLISKRRIGKRWLFTVVDGMEETEQVIQTIGGGEATRTESSFDEAVVAYLSRSRTSESFLQRG